MNGNCPAARLLIFVSCLFAGSVWADHDGKFDFRFTTSQFNYDVIAIVANPYDCTLEDPPPGADLNFFPTNQAILAGLALDSGASPQPGKPAGYHPGYTDLGFPTPEFDPDHDEVRMFDCAPDSVHDDEHCDSGRANDFGITMPSTIYCADTELNLRRVMGHELFHKVQRAYGTNSLSWGSVLTEGTARMMSDHIYSDIDETGTAFTGQVEKYMEVPNREFWRLSYDSALAWKYAAEQFGTTTTEPQVGVDFIRRLFETTQASADNPDLPAAMEATIQFFEPSMTLRQWFQDFTIASVAREFDASSIPDPEKYRYIDEQAAGRHYENVARAWTGDIGASNPALDSVLRWGASYYEATIGTGCQTGMILGYRVKNIDDTRHALLAINDTDKVARLVRGGGNDFAVSFVQRDLLNRYERLIGVVTGANDSDVIGWQFDCGLGALQILSPNAVSVAAVGPQDEPRALIVRLSVTGPESLSNPIVLGLQPGDFTVYVGTDGNAPDLATVIGGVYVQGEYWLTVQPPVKSDDDTYDLHVSLDPLNPFVSDTEVDAVSYLERVYDQVLVIDRSGSMGSPAGSPKIDAARNAASLFVDIAIATDQVGAVSFSGDGVEPNVDATLDEPLDEATDEHRSDVKNAIAGILDGGRTSIGDGLELAAAQIAVNGSAKGEDWIILLSDGMENEENNWTQVEAAIKAAGIRVNSIALGEDADQVLLQEIADETGGDYYYVDVDTTGRQMAGGDLSLANRLADAYASASESMMKRQRLWETDEQLNEGQTLQQTVPLFGGGIARGIFLWHWSDPADALSVTLLRPNGTPVVDGQNGARIHTSATHVVIHVPDLFAGSWTVDLQATTGNPDFIGILSGDDHQGPELQVEFGQPSSEPIPNLFAGAIYLRGLPQPIRALLVDRDGLVTGAEVIARIEHPDDRIIELPLFDDGNHNDGFPGDGVYGNDYTRTTDFSYPDQLDLPGSGVRGSYNVSVEALGRDNAGQEFTRIRKVAFQVFETDFVSTLPPPDSDGDGMPDRYEDLHDCLDKTVDDGASDSDEDGLSNFGSWSGGLDPCHPDTDRGGETDVSEFARGANPFDPRDDSVPRPIDAEVVDWIYEHLDFPEPWQLLSAANLIRYPVHPSYDQIRLLRSLSADGPFAEAAVFGAMANGGLYSDQGLTNGVTYYYRVQPIDINGSLATPSHVFSGTPNADPIPPIGSVRINLGALTTTDPLARLSLTANSDTTSMMIANEASFDGSLWQPYHPTAVWMLEPHPVSNIARVFVKYRDSAFNESPSVYLASIEVVNGADFGTLTGQGKLAGAASSANIAVHAPDAGTVSPDFTDAGGAFTLANVPPGRHDILFSYPGYENEVVEGVLAVAGQTTDMGTTILTPVDTDGDGIADFDDNCTEIANADQLDTNGDNIGNACDADINNDCSVNFGDVAALKEAFFPNPYDADVDFNGDGFVNFADIAHMKATFFNGDAPGPGPSGLPNGCD